MNKRKTWAVYGRGPIGSELVRQTGLPHVAERFELQPLPEYIVCSQGLLSSDGTKVIAGSPADFEIPDVSFIALPSSDDGQTAYDYIRPILEAGKWVVTAEKGALANYFDELQVLSDNFARFGINAAVGGGMRAMDVAGIYSRDPENIAQLHAVLNGTLTYIFDTIGPLKGKGAPLKTAASQAVTRGYAEPGFNNPLDIIVSEATGDVPKKTAIFLNRLGILPSRINWRDLDFKLSVDDSGRILTEAAQRRLVISAYNQNLTTDRPESGIIGGFTLEKDNWLIVAGFRDIQKKTLFQGSLGHLKGAQNGVVIQLGPNGSDSPDPIVLTGTGAGPAPTVNTMLDDYAALAR